MVNIKKLLILTLVLIVTLPFITFAEENRVYDEANFFTEEEIVEFNNHLEKIKEQYNMDFILVTITDAKGKTAKDFANDFFDSKYEIDHNGGILFIDMDNREIRVSASGTAIDYLTDYRQDQILESALAYVKDENYSEASRGMIRRTEEFLYAGIPSNQHRVPEEKSQRLSVMDVLAGLGVGGAVGGGFFNVNKRRYKGSPKENTFYYEKNSIVNLSNSQDNLVDTRVTSRIIPVSSDKKDSGQSTTYKSSSGGTKSSSGKKF